MADRVIGGVARALAAIAGAALLLMLVLTVGNMFLRTFTSPYYGTFELVGLLAVLVNGLALAVAQREKSHVAINLVMSRFGMRTQLVVGVVITTISIVLFLIVARQLVLYGLNLRAQGALTDSMRLPFWPFSLALAVGVGGLVLALLGDLLAMVRNLRSSQPEGIW